MHGSTKCNPNMWGTDAVARSPPLAISAVGCGCAYSTSPASGLRDRAPGVRQSRRELAVADRPPEDVHVSGGGIAQLEALPPARIHDQHFSVEPVAHQADGLGQIGIARDNDGDVALCVDR